MGKWVLCLLAAGLISENASAEGFFLETLEEAPKAAEVKPAPTPSLSCLKAPKLQLDYHIKTIFDMVPEEFVALLPDSRDPNVQRRNFYKERMGRVKAELAKGDGEAFASKMQALESILASAEDIGNKNQRIDFISERVSLGGSDRLEQSIYVGNLYLMLAIYHFEGVLEPRDLLKTQRYLERVNLYDSGVAKIVSFFRSPDMTSSMLQDGLEVGLPFEEVYEFFKTVFEPFKKNGLKTEKIRLEYVYALNSFIIYLEESGNAASFRDFDRYVEELGNEYDSLSKINQHFGIVGR